VGLKPISVANWLPSVLLHCWLGHLTCKNRPQNSRYYARNTCNHKKVQSCGYGCYVRNICVSIILYADDILLLAPSVSSLQQLLYVLIMSYSV